MLTRQNFAKYSKSKERQSWIEQNYENYYNLIPFLKDIDYRIPSLTNVPVDITFYTEGGENDEEKTELGTFEIQASLDSQFTYYFFGGTVYNILNKNVFDENGINGETLLELFVDNTGDIDVGIQYPPFDDITNIETIKTELSQTTKIQEKNIFYSLNQYVPTNNETVKRINIYYEKYSTDLYNKIFEKLTIMVKNKKINFSYAVPFNFAEESYDEFSSGSLDNLIDDKAHLVKVCVNDMIKIQLVIKINVDGDTFLVDHLFEIIISCNDLVDVEMTKKRTIMFDTINNVNIQNINLLLTQNFYAYFDRRELVNNTQNMHKPINHVGRLLYLLYLFKEYQTDIYIKDNIDIFANIFLFQTNMFIYKLSKKVRSINKDNAVLTYYKINKSNDSLILHSIKLKDIIYAFLDVLYLIESDGTIKKRNIKNFDTYLLVGKKISDVLNLKDGSSENSYYNSILRLLYENLARTKIKPIVNYMRDINQEERIKRFDKYTEQFERVDKIRSKKLQSRHRELKSTKSLPTRKIRSSKIGSQSRRKKLNKPNSI